MSQEDQKVEKSPERRKKIMLGGLLVAFAGVVYFQFFTGTDAPSRQTNIVRPSGAPTPTTRATPRPGTAPVEIVSEPLNLAAMLNKEGLGAGTGRNIFVYPTPTPVPPPPPVKPTPTPPPPPITLISVNPTGVIARTGDFTLTVFGDKIPPDAQGYIDGREFPTSVVNAAELKINVPAEAIRTAGNLGIQVRSKSDAKLFSNQASLGVAEPPTPPYRYIGLIVSKNGSLAVLKSQSDDEVVNVVKGQIFGRHWRVISISPQKIEVEDTNIKIQHTINYTGENG